MTTSPRRLVASLVAAVAVTAAGVLIVDLTTGSGGPASTGRDVGSAGATDPNGNTTQLSIVDFTFDPNPAILTAGSTMTIVNKDGAAHTVTSGTRDDPGKVFNVKVAADGTGRLVITKPGIYPYICTIHPGMKGTLRVVA